MAVLSYRQLDVWQLAMDLVERCYAITPSFPRDERFGLTSQIQRAAVSVPSNIAEGQARGTTKEFLHFLSIARGSLAEFETQLLLAQRLQFVTKQTTEEIVEMTARIGRMISGLQAALKRRLQQNPD